MLSAGVSIGYSLSEGYKFQVWGLKCSSNQGGSFIMESKVHDVFSSCHPQYQFSTRIRFSHPPPSAAVHSPSVPEVHGVVHLPCAPQRPRDGLLHDRGGAQQRSGQLAKEVAPAVGLPGTAEKGGGGGADGRVQALEEGLDGNGVSGAVKPGRGGYGRGGVGRKA